jgi:hypothetical protein
MHVFTSQFGFPVQTVDIAHSFVALIQKEKYEPSPEITQYRQT